MANLVTNIGGNASGLISACEKSKTALKKLNNEQKEMKGAIGQLTSALGINIGKLTAWGAAIATVKGGITMMKDMLMSNEQTVDAWGRTVESAGSLYRGFLDALNTGDISGFLSNIGDIITAAQNAYNALDDLATYNAFNQINRARLTSGFNSAIADYREGKGSKKDVINAGKDLRKNIREEAVYQIQAFFAKVSQAAHERGVDPNRMMGILGARDNKALNRYKHMTVPKRMINGFLYDAPRNSEEKLASAIQRFTDEELQALQAIGAKFYSIKDQENSVRRRTARIANSKEGSENGSGKSGSGKGGSSRGGSSGNSKVDEQEYEAQTQALNISTMTLGDWTFELGNSISSLKKYISAQEDAYENATTSTQRAAAKANKARAESYLNRIENGQDPTLIQRLSEARSDYYTKNKTAKVDLSGTGRGAFSDFVDVDAAKKKMEELEAELKPIMDVMAKDLADSVIKPLEIGPTGNPLEGKAIAAATAWGHVGDILGQVGQAFSQIESPELQAGAIIAQALASVALSFAQSLAATGGKLGIWGWIAGGLAGVGALITISNAIKNASAYAEGGIVDGNSYTGDKLWARVNSGEMILNRRQQANALRMIDANGVSSSAMPATITLRARGKDLVGVLSTTNKISSKI